jgi:hypothetical protein
VHSRVRFLSLILVVAAIAAAFLLIPSKRSGAQTVTLALAAPPGTPVVGVGDPLPVHAVAPGFAGLSLEYSALRAYAGNGAGGLDPVFVQLIRNLTPGQAPVLRIGGDSTDTSWVAVPGMRRPRGIKYTIGPAWLRTAGALTRALHARIIFGINLEADSTKLAAIEARTLIRAVGRSSVEALEVGNEPELYGSFRWYTAPNGIGFPGRPRNYDLHSYIGDFENFAASLPSVPLAGPATGGPKWMAHMRQFVTAAPRLGLVTAHRYPLDRCFTARTSNKYPTIRHLLARRSSAGLADTIAHDVSIAHADGLPLRVDELNSVSCEGKRGVSNTFASALWMLDTLFQMARVGVDGVNVHTLPDSQYQPFRLRRSNGRWLGRVDPEYYGILMFTQAAPPGSRLLALSGSQPGQVRTWAARARDGRVRVVLINVSSSQPRYIGLRVAGMARAAALARLLAPSLAATGDVSVGGQSFGRTTSTGVLRGQPLQIAVVPVAGKYVVRLPPASAAMLTFTPAQH